ncbi:Helicase superfamily 1/2, DinG/Rad3-like protein, partial [Aduncisulcus paluster]
MKTPFSFEITRIDNSGSLDYILKVARSAFFVAGTLSPISFFTSSLFPKVSQSSIYSQVFSHVSPLSHRRVFIHTTPGFPTYSTPLPLTMANRSECILRSMFDGFELLASQVPFNGGCVYFFPSMAFLKHFISVGIRAKRLQIHSPSSSSSSSSSSTFSTSFLESSGICKDKDVPIYIFGNRVCLCETQDAISTRKVLQKYEYLVKKSRRSNPTKKCSVNAPILFAVAGGKVSEGLDFSDNLARLVVIVSVPFSSMVSPLLAARSHILGKKLSQQWYIGDAMRKVNQAAGRAIRHSKDYASIVFVDERYSKEYLKSRLSDWLAMSSVISSRGYDQIAAVFKKFFGQYDADSYSPE